MEDGSAIFVHIKGFISLCQMLIKLVMGANFTIPYIMAENKGFQCPFPSRNMKTPEQFVVKDPQFVSTKNNLGIFFY